MTIASYLFMEFKNADDAAYAMGAMNGHPFDSRHTFWANRFTDVERFTNMDEAWVEPEPEPYKPKVCQVLPYHSPCAKMLTGA